MLATKPGHKIRLCLTEYRTLEINTPEDLLETQDFVYAPPDSTESQLK